MKNTNKQLDFWKKSEYYQRSKEGSQDTNHPAMKKLFDFAQNANSILDLGCGEGTRLNWIVNGRNVEAMGIDISQTGIDIARKQYPKINFFQDDIEDPTKIKEKFKLVYSAYVLEHVNEPKKVIGTALKYCQEGGIIIFIAPNFGAPNRRSPNSIENKKMKFIKGILDDLKGDNKLNWQKVTPQKAEYTQVDDDALSEPYLLSLKRFCQSQNTEILFASSCWQVEPWSKNPRKSLFKILGEGLHLFPFTFWGPHFILVMKKI